MMRPAGPVRGAGKMVGMSMRPTDINIAGAVDLSALHAPAAAPPHAAPAPPTSARSGTLRMTTAETTA